MKKGERHGKLRAIEKLQSQVSEVWSFQCDCGAIHLATTANVKSGGTQSCGCYKAVRRSERAAINKSQAGDRQKEMISIIDELNLSANDVAKITLRSPNTVYSWISRDNQTISSSALKRLREYHVNTHKTD